MLTSREKILVSAILVVFATGMGIRHFRTAISLPEKGGTQASEGR